MTTSDVNVDDAFGELIASLGEAAAFVRSHEFSSDGQRAAGYAFVLAMLIARLEDQVVFDPDVPYFRVIDPRTREGGDNADQRYLSSRLNGGDSYRIWGNVGSARRLDVQIYAGAPFESGSRGRMASFLSFEDLDVAGDGTFDVIASPSPTPGNWLENPQDGTAMLVRQVYSDWDDDAPGEVHIDRIGHEGSLKPALTDGVLADRLRAAAADLGTRVNLWPAFVAARYLDTAPVNTISPLMDPGSLGGVPGRWMAHGTFDLADDEALIVTTWPAPGNYQGIQLCDLWFSSLEYANRQTSLTGDQAHLDADGCYRFVVAGADPGVANWLDTTGFRRGVILLRFDGTDGTSIDPDHQPVAQKVALAELAGHLPAGTPRCTPADRTAQLARRRRHVQRRFGF